MVRLPYKKQQTAAKCVYLELTTRPPPLPSYHVCTHLQRRRTLSYSWCNTNATGINLYMQLHMLGQLLLQMIQMRLDSAKSQKSHNNVPLRPSCLAGLVLVGVGGERIYVGSSISQRVLSMTRTWTHVRLGECYAQVGNPTRDPWLYSLVYSLPTKPSLHHYMYRNTHWGRLYGTT